MRLAIMAAAGFLLAPAVLAADAESLSFTVGEDRLTIAPQDIDSAAPEDRIGLTLCLDDEADAAVSDFTKAHRGAVVDVRIGETMVFQPKIGEPYEGGCIKWPLHPVLAERYRARLLGEEPAK